MLIRASLLRKIDISMRHVSRQWSLCSCERRILPLRFLLGPCHHLQRVTFSSSDRSSSAECDVANKLCIYQPDVRRVRIVTMNDADDAAQDAMLSNVSSVQRDTIYTRQHVSRDDPAVQTLFRGIREGSRAALARAITLIESTHPRRRAEAQVLLREVLEHSRTKRRHSLHRVNSFRIGNSVFLSCDGN